MVKLGANDNLTNFSLIFLSCKHNPNIGSLHTELWAYSSNWFLSFAHQVAYRLHIKSSGVTWSQPDDNSKLGHGFQISWSIFSLLKERRLSVLGLVRVLFTVQSQGKVAYKNIILIPENHSAKNKLFQSLKATHTSHTKFLAPPSVNSQIWCQNCPQSTYRRRDNPFP
jgi:hypothetical protein